jgi:hypothetical protein
VKSSNAISIFVIIRTHTHTHNQKELREMGEGIFSSSKPRDAMDGMSKGAGNILKGVMGGAALLVAAPVKVIWRCIPSH